MVNIYTSTVRRLTPSDMAKQVRHHHDWNIHHQYPVAADSVIHPFLFLRVLAKKYTLTEFSHVLNFSDYIDLVGSSQSNWIELSMLLNSMDKIPFSPISFKSAIPARMFYKQNHFLIFSMHVLVLRNLFWFIPMECIAHTNDIDHPG